MKNILDYRLVVLDKEFYQLIGDVMEKFSTEIIQSYYLVKKEAKR